MLKKPQSVTQNNINGDNNNGTFIDADYVTMPRGVYDEMLETIKAQRRQIDALLGMCKGA